MTLAIEQYLSQHLWDIAKNYNIPEHILSERPKLIELILESKSLSNSEEKQSWFSLLPVMNEEQVNKLDDILTREKEKIEEINKKYANKQAELTQKQQIYSSENHLASRNRIKEQEHHQREQELVEADNLLNDL